MSQNFTTIPETRQSNSQQGPEAEALGTNTKLCVTDIKSEDILVSRYELQAASRDILPNERVAKCLRHRVNAEYPTEILYHPEHKRACYGNLMTCGSVWTCPVCAAKITERRRKELQAGIDVQTADNGALLMFTFTASHSQLEACETVLSDMTQAHRKFWANRFGRNLKDNFGIIGTVRGLEVTHGVNGWHVHFHTLVFFEGPLSTWDLTLIGKGSQEEWQKVCAKNGRYASQKHGFKMTANRERIADYVAKNGKDESQWTLSHEVSKSVVKNAKKGGRTPNRLLFDYIRGDKQAGKLYQEYAMAFKGKSHLKWSKGLREILGLTAEEKTDEEVMNEYDGNAFVMATLTKSVWVFILQNDLRAEVLNIASKGSQAELKRFFEGLGQSVDYCRNVYFDGFYFEVAPDT